MTEPRKDPQAEQPRAEQASTAMRETAQRVEAQVQELEQRKARLQRESEDMEQRKARLVAELDGLERTRATVPRMREEEEPYQLGDGVLGTTIPLSLFTDNPDAMTRAQEQALRARLRQAGYTVRDYRHEPFYVCSVMKGSQHIQHMGGSEKAALVYVVKTLHEGQLWQSPVLSSAR